MKKSRLIIAAVVAALATGCFLNSVFAQESTHHAETSRTEKLNDMKLGAFSISLSVKDLKTSKEFYEKLGFDVFAGSMEQNYLIMKNENALIGLFQGMFEGNILTFNPGWDEDANRTFENQFFPFPPLKEQQAIVRQLDALRTETQKLEGVYQKKIEDLEELKKSILQKAFAGELRSPEGAIYTNDGFSPSDKKNIKTSPERV